MRPLMLIAIFVLSISSETVFATKSSVDVHVFRRPVSKSGQMTVDSGSSGCYWLRTGEALIEAQRGVGKSGSATTKVCRNGFVATRALTFLKVREVNSPMGWSVLRAISSEIGVVCCPLSFTWA